ncbi:hypothetical protein PENTCL1PPCAC_29664, partial [Pristionchus entomophagus]
IDWSTRGTSRPVFGAVCIAVCCLGIIPYIICMRIVWEIQKQACYKMMFYLAIVDILTLFGNVLAGVVFIVGGMYCHAPWIFLLISFLVGGGYYASCCTCFMIAVNRLVELFAIRPLHKLFLENRPWFLMLIPTAYALSGIICAPLAFANSETHIFHLDPMISDRYEYKSYFNTLNNFAAPSICSLLYLAMIINVIARKKKLSIQCGVIVIVHMYTCLSYILIPYIINETIFDAVLYTMHINWLIMHGLPPYVYFLFNPSIRRGVLQFANPNLSIHVSTT